MDEVETEDTDDESDDADEEDELSSSSFRPKIRIDAVISPPLAVNLIRSAVPG